MKVVDEGIGLSLVTVSRAQRCENCQRMVHAGLRAWRSAARCGEKPVFVCVMCGRWM